MSENTFYNIQLRTPGRYGATRHRFLAQRFARHASPLTTTIYTHPSDKEMQGKLRKLTC